MSDRGGPQRSRRWLAALATVVLLPPITSVLGGAAPATAASLSGCVNHDNGVPVVQETQLTPSTVDVSDAPAQVTLRLRVVDHGGPGQASGVASVSALLDSDPGLVPLRLSPVGGDWWAGTFTVPQHSPDTTWRLWSLSIDDAAGNGLPESVAASVNDHQPPFDGSLRVIDSAPDLTDPTVTGIDLGRATVDTTHRARTVPIDVTAADDLSGIERVEVLAVRGHYTEQAVLTPDPQGRLSGGLRIPRWRGNGTWRVSLMVEDRVGNMRYYHSRELATMDRASFTVTSGKDTGRPVLSSFARHPHSIDIRRHADTVRFVVRATDRRSGVADVSIYLPGVSPSEGSGVSTVALTRTGGSARHGTWTGRLRLQPCTIIHTSTRFAVTLHDRAERERYAMPHTVLRVRTPDLFVPRARVQQPEVGPSGPFTISFNEPVNGVDARNAPVSTSDGVAQAGAWRCVTSGGASTSCATGRVSRASWTPDAPLTTPGDYHVELDPEGVLGLTDLNGNPLRRVTCFFQTQAEPPASDQFVHSCSLPNEYE